MRVCAILPLLVQLGAASLSTSSIQLRKRMYDLRVQSGDLEYSALYPMNNFAVPIDHFHNDSLYEPHTDEKFNLRYWFDASYYEPGGPVILLQGGETSGADRLPFLQKGIAHELAKANGGIAVVIEHRYYGESFPTTNLSTDSLRFLTTDQALADCAYFARHVSFPGIKDQNITSYTTPYIAYGGSYAGAFVAFLRILYPDVFWGAISSSGVTEAIYDYWQYMEIIADAGPPACINTTQKLIHAVDNILIGQKGTKLPTKLKETFGMDSLDDDSDFTSVLSSPLGYWQGRNWDPAVGNNEFFHYCDVITSTSLLYPNTKALTSSVRQLLANTSYGDEVDILTVPMLNLIGYINTTVLQSCDDSLESCFGSNDVSQWARDDLSQTWRSWPYQCCTQWGYLQSGASYPSDRFGLLSRTITLEYEARVCRHAFNITKPPDVEAINKFGGFNISYPRLAIIDGEVDPWRAATPHARSASDRESTLSEPFILIEDAVHHWDENGLFPNETTPSLPPSPIVEVHKQELEFVQSWLKEATEYFDRPLNLAPGTQEVMI